MVTPLPIKIGCICLSRSNFKSESLADKPVLSPVTITASANPRSRASTASKSMVQGEIGDACLQRTSPKIRGVDSVLIQLSCFCNLLRI